MNAPRKPPLLNAPPNLKVIDQAISYLRSGQNTYSCKALERAAFVIECATYERAWLYRKQYQMYTLGPNLEAPYWWNTSTPYLKERIAALKAFRKACVEAAKKEN